MINLLISLGIGVGVTILIRLLGFPLWAGIIPGAIAAAAAYLLLARRVATKVQALMGLVQKDLSTSATNQREQKARIEKAIKTLESGLQYEKWQFLVASEIHAQICAKS